MTNIFSSRDSREALELLSEQLAMQVRRKKEEPFFLALSGGETAQQMFRLWTERFSGRIDWDTIRFYWVDERCVPPQDSESNYGHAHELLFGPLNILPAHIHRIQGEEEPAAEDRALMPLTSKPRMIAEKILFLFMMFPFLAGVL